MKNIWSIKVFTQNTIVFVGPRKTTIQISELHFPFSFLLKKNERKSVSTMALLQYLCLYELVLVAVFLGVYI